jgi:hypothetical protein
VYSHPVSITLDETLQHLRFADMNLVRLGLLIENAFQLLRNATAMYFPKTLINPCAKSIFTRNRQMCNATHNVSEQDYTKKQKMFEPS